MHIRGLNCLRSTWSRYVRVLIKSQPHSCSQHIHVFFLPFEEVWRSYSQAATCMAWSCCIFGAMMDSGWGRGERWKIWGQLATLPSSISFGRAWSWLFSWERSWNIGGSKGGSIGDFELQVVLKMHWKRNSFLWTAPSYSVFSHCSQNIFHVISFLFFH